MCKAVLRLVSAPLSSLLTSTAMVGCLAAYVPAPAQAVDYVVNTSVASVPTLTGNDSLTVTPTGEITGSFVYLFGLGTPSFVNNQGSIQAGIIASISLISGAITNSGTITDGVNSAITINTTSLNGGLTNSGTISAAAEGIFLDRGSSISAITNSGLISGGSNGIRLNNGSSIGDLTNTGTITGAGDGIYAEFGGASISVGNIANSGSITGSGGSALRFQNVGATLGSLTNSGTMSGYADGIYLYGVTVNGITNEVGGTISSSFASGIQTTSGVFINGGIVNDGTITGATHGINSFSGQITGGLTNTGSITGSSGNGLNFTSNTNLDFLNNSGTIFGGTDAIYLSASTITGGIVNAAGGTISSGTLGNAIRLENAASITGGIVNHGTISDTYFNSDRGAVHIASGSSITGGLTNTGIMSGNGLASLYVTDSGSSLDFFTNSGTLSGVVAIYLDNSGSVGSITNSGTISSGGIGLNNGSYISGALNNSGTIVGSNYGIYLFNSSSISGGLNNSGTISGQSGLDITNGAIGGPGLVNSGTIVGTSGYGVSVTNSSTIVDVIDNSGTIRGTTGLIINANGIPGGITNSGTIHGTGGTAMLLDIAGPYDLFFNGGRVIGDVLANNIANDFGNLTIGGNFATEGNITVSRASVSSGNRLTLSSGNTLTVNSMPSTGGGTIAFTVNSSASTPGRIAVTGAGEGINLTGTPLAVNYTGGAIANGSEWRIGTGNAAITGGPGGTRTSVADNSFLWNFSIADGTAASAPTNNSELYLFASQNTNINYTTSGNANVASTIISLSGSANAQLQQVVANLSKASTEADINRIAESTQPTVDGAAFTAANTFSAQTFELANARLASLKSGSGSGMQFASAFSYAPSAYTSQGFAFAPLAQDSQQLAAPDDSARSLRLGSISPSAGVSALSGSAWAQGFGQALTQRAQDGFASYEADTAGIAFGMDSAELLKDSVLGVAVSYGRTDIRSNNANRAGTDVDNYQVTLYGSHDLGSKTFLRAQAAYAKSNNSTVRYDVGGISGLTAEGSYGANFYALQSELGREYQYANVTLVPSALAHYSYYAPDDYTETNSGGAGLRVRQSAQQSAGFGVGLAARTDYTLDNGARLTPEARIGLRHNPRQDRAETSSSFTAGGAAFASSGASPDKTTGSLGASLAYTPDSNWELKTGYDLHLRQNATAHAAFVMTTIRF